jgi:hypothetical protein
MNSHGQFDTPDRRAFLYRLARAGATATMGLTVVSSIVSAAMQDNWRLCDKCHMLFHYSYGKGLCPAGSRHHGDMTINYLLPYDVRADAHAQGAWRSCSKCESLFFDGYTPKGSCPGGQGHVAQGPVFVLRHEVNDRFTTKNWRYCTKCHALFLDKDGKDKGKCAAKGGHSESGFNFSLEYQTATM